MSENGTLRSKRPQLNDSITKLDDVIDGLATAIPGAVADSIREVLGPAFAAAVKQAVKEAVTEAFKERASEPVEATPVSRSVSPPAALTQPQPKRDRWAKVKAALSRLKTWAKQQVAPLVARTALGWAVVRLVGGATVHSRSATFMTAFTGAVAGLAGWALGPIAAAVLLGLSSGVIAAAAIWAAPMARLLVAFRGE